MPERTHLKGARILVVEDEALVAELAAEMLKDLGCVPLGPAHTVDAALAVINNGEKIDCAALDVRLNSEISGLVADALMLNDIPFVVCSAYTITLFDNRHIPIVGKPYTREQLKEGLERALGLFPDTDASAQNQQLGAICR
jgi:CheY-like chemotaxis protein